MCSSSILMTGPSAVNSVEKSSKQDTVSTSTCDLMELEDTAGAVKNAGKHSTRYQPTMFTSKSIPASESLHVRIVG